MLGRRGRLNVQTTAEDIKSITIVSTSDWSIRHHRCRRSSVLSMTFFRCLYSSPTLVSLRLPRLFGGFSQYRLNSLLRRAPFDVSNDMLHKLSTARRNSITTIAWDLSLAILPFDVRKEKKHPVSGYSYEPPDVALRHLASHRLLIN